MNPFKLERHPVRWKPPRWKWKNLLCPTCHLWVDRERLVAHAQTPTHKSAAEKLARARRAQ